MKLKLLEKPKIDLFKDSVIMFVRAKGNLDTVKAFEDKWQGDTDEYQVIIEPYKKARSLDSNAYAWVLIGKLARKLGTDQISVYKEFVKQTSNYTIVPIKCELVDKWGQIWASKGYGWFIEDMGDCKNIKGYRNIKSYYGTSVYNTAEMSHFIDLILSECKEQNIETMTPEEIKHMMSLERR